jgi:hypothetical protein
MNNRLGLLRCILYFYVLSSIMKEVLPKDEKEPESWIGKLAREQDVKPFDPDRIPKDIWPDDEIDEFIKVIDELRKNNPAGYNPFDDFDIIP